MAEACIHIMLNYDEKDFINIGCGEDLYEQLLRSTKIILDCDNQQIIILEHEIDDQYIEEKKILRSLGYIK